MDYKALYEQLQKEIADTRLETGFSLAELVEVSGHNDFLEEDAFNERELRFAAEAENKKLKAENERLHTDVKCRAKQLETYLSMIEKLKKEAEEANEDADSLVEAYEKLAKKKLVEHFDAVKEVAKIRAENEKLKADVERLEKHREEIMEGHLEFNKKAGEFHRKKVAELQAENDKLNEECDRRVGAEDYDEAVEHSVKLQNVWIELYARDKDGCDVDWKTIASITDYDEEKSKKLYEVCYGDDFDEES